MSEVELDSEYIFDIPPNCRTIEYNGYWLVVHPEDVKWMVFSDQEYQIYKTFYEGNSIAAALELFSEENVIRVATEIIAKGFMMQSDIESSNNSNLFIYLTNRCNLRCAHCYMFSGDLEIEELPVSKWITLIDQFAEIGGRAITFSGGEPLLYPGFSELIEYTHCKGIKICVLTNALLWTASFSKQMQGKIDEIQISLDGYDDETYGQVRNIKHGFSDVMDKIAMLDSYGFHISLAVTPLYNGLEDFCNNYREFGKKFMEMYPDIHIGFSFELIPGRSIAISKEKNEMYTLAIKDLVEALYPDYRIDNFVENIQGRTKIISCGFGNLTIASNGDVFPCNRICELQSLGSILTSSLSELTILGNVLMQNTSVDNTFPCANCEIKYICGGGCRLQYIKTPSSEFSYSYECAKKDKDNFLERMILANEYFYL